MDADHEYSFKISAFTPRTLPMARLAEYMADLAKLLGNDKGVHFVRLYEGSATVAYRVEAEVDSKVAERVFKARAGSGPQEAINAIASINRRLDEDSGTGAIVGAEGAEIIRFPGSKAGGAEFGGVIRQPEALDGFVIRLGGRREWIPVHFETRDGRAFSGSASRTLAKALARYLFGAELRVIGYGNWTRRPIVGWQLDRFYIQRFEVLNEEPLSAVVSKLHNVKGAEWSNFADPWAEFADIRHGSTGN